MPEPDDVDYGDVDEELFIPEPPTEDEDDDAIGAWMGKLGRSLNALHHSVAALHRKVDNMTPVDLGPLEDAVNTLVTDDATLTTAVQGGAAELKTLKEHAEAIEKQLNNGEPVDASKVAAILSGVTSVGSHLETLANTLSTATTDAEAQSTASGSAGASGGLPTASGSAGDSGGTPTASGSVGTQSYTRDAEGFVLYTGQGDPSTFDTAAWIKSTELQAPGPVALYKFATDVPNGPPTGVVPGWAPYSGPTEAVPAA